MIAPTMHAPAPNVARNPTRVSHLTDLFHDEAALEMHAAFGDVSGKKLEAASVPGAGRHGISRALNGCESNPLYRIAALFLVMKRLGMGRERALRMIGWLSEIVDQIWPPEEAPCPKEVLQKEQELDALDDVPQQRLAWGDKAAAVEMLEIKRQQHALDAVVIQVLRRMVMAP